MKASYVMNVVTDYYQVNLTLKGRSQKLVRPRQIAMYLCRRHTKLSYPHIALLFHLDHSTVLHNCRKIKLTIETDAKLKSDVKDLDQILESEKHRKK